MDARREDDHPDAEEELDKKSRLEGKDGEPAAQDNKASQDFNKRKEIFRLVSERENSSIAFGSGSQTSDTATPLGNVRQLGKSAVLHIAAGSISGCLVAAGTRILIQPLYIYRKL